MIGTRSIGCIVDIGSTTVDVIPILEGRTTNAQTDRQRMQLG